MYRKVQKYYLKLSQKKTDVVKEHPENKKLGNIQNSHRFNQKGWTHECICCSDYEVYYSWQNTK